MFSTKNNHETFVQAWSNVIALAFFCDLPKKRLIVFFIDLSEIFFFAFKFDSGRGSRMSFWLSLGSQQSTLDAILDNPSVKLEEILNMDDFLFEIQNQNKKVIELYLLTPH